jgi:hypothetical protein
LYILSPVHVYIRVFSPQMNISIIHNMVLESKNLGFPLFSRFFFHFVIACESFLASSSRSSFNRWTTLLLVLIYIMPAAIRRFAAPVIATSRSFLVLTASLCCHRFLLDRVGSRSPRRLIEVPPRAGSTRRVLERRHRLFFWNRFNSSNVASGSI